MKARIAILILILAAFAAAVTGCGRRGALDTPSQAAAEKRGEKPADEAAEPKDKRFILDGLIE